MSAQADQMRTSQLASGSTPAGEAALQRSMDAWQPGTYSRGMVHKVSTSGTVLRDPRDGCVVCRWAPQASCSGALRRRGIVKVHWECWSACNLGCPFCFRTRDVPVDTENAKRIIDAVAAGGAQTLAFAGGDPTLRVDLLELVRYAEVAGMRVEVQTNAHAVGPVAWSALLASDRVCLSLDGSTPERHDAVRKTRGNFAKVVRTADVLSRAGIALTVRTVVTRENCDDVVHIAPIISRFSTCERWTLLEFTPVNEGYDNRARYELQLRRFEGVTEAVREAFVGPGEIDVFCHAEKIGTYMQVTAGGEVYGTTAEALEVTGRHMMSGNLLTDHLDAVANALPFDVKRHRIRYSPELTTVNAGP
jgi:MoaA/NifB/PqqE/SkfB family radical SAM enzyme